NRTDLYQFGCLLFYALTGRYAFDGDTTAAVMQAHFDNTPRDLATLRPDLPEPVRTWLLWHLNLSPDDRPDSAKESLATLQSVLAGNAVPHVTLPGTRPPSASTTKVPLNRPATNSPTPTPSTATQAYLAKVAAKNSPATKPPTPRPKKKSNNNNTIGVATGIWIAVIVLMLVAFSGIAIYALKDNSPDPQTAEAPQLPEPLPEPGSESETKPQAPAAPAAIVHLDASKATFTDAAKTPANAGDRVAHWADTSPAGGDNPAQYHVTDHKNPPSRWPLLKTGKDGSLSLDFDGRRNLLVGRSGAGDPLTPALAKKSITLVLRFLARPPKNTADAAGRRYLAGLHTGDNKRSLDTFIRDGKLFFGFISKPGLTDLSQRSLPVTTGRYTVAFAVADPAFRTILLETWTPAGKNKTSTSAVDTIEPFTKIKELRIGGPGISAGQANLFNGEISDVLLFDRPLDAPERRALAKKLNQKPRP
ncbi:MAG: hypothetical protein P8J87_13995, partial [Verrucomicrobiales bacterium]|nr:hypothetical protein [Verrucomicrobiales bacterium]